jgi:hypothetical protein
LAEEGTLHTGRERQLRRQWGGSPQLARGQPGGQLEQRKRIPAGLSHQPVADLVGQCLPGTLDEQPPGRIAVEATDAHHRQPAGVEGPYSDAVAGAAAGPGVAGGEHDGHRVGLQLTRREQQRARGRGIQPLRIVDDAAHGAVLGGLGQRRQGSHPDQERLDRRPLLQPERHPQRARLRNRKPLEAKHRPQQPVQRGERQRRLGLDAMGAEHTYARHVRRGLLGRDQVLQESGLADPRLTQNHQDRGPPGPGMVRECGKPPAFHVATL